MGGSGNDAITGNQAANKLYGYAGNDIMNGDTGHDTLYGGVGSDKLYGSSGNDALVGDAGNDALYGGTGADRLYGGSGNDTFAFRLLAESTVGATGRDTIYDFAASDRINVSAIDANSTASGDQAFTFVGTAAFSGKNGELRYDRAASDTYIYGDVNGDKKADFAIRLDDAVTLQKGYFLL